MVHPEAKPRWVRYDEKIVNVSEFSYLTPSKRPSVFCPACNEEVILKLGEKNIHHYAHQATDRAGVVCSMTQPETALHYNMKYYLQDVLQYGSQITIKNKCETCSNHQLEAFITGWDSVEVEYSIDKYSLDVALLRDGVCIGAIEVYVTHQVDRQKFNFLKENNISLLEIQGDSNFYSGTDKWYLDKPMPHIQVSPRPSSWICKDCQTQISPEFKPKMTLDQLPLPTFAYSELTTNTSNVMPLQAFKVVDNFYLSGEMKREIYIRDNDELRLDSGEMISFGSEAFMLRMLKIRLADKERYIKVIVDEVIDWQPLTLRNDNTIVSTEPNYFWNGKTSSWDKKQ